MTDCRVPLWSEGHRKRIGPFLILDDLKKATAWNAKVHPAKSGVSANQIRQAIEPYIDFQWLASFLSPTLGENGFDSLLVEAIHQFQQKAYLLASEHDGLAGSSTLDSLGFVPRTGLRKSYSYTDYQIEFLKDVEKKTGAITDLGLGLTAETWFDFMVGPSIFGVSPNRPIHISFLLLLCKAEKYLLSLERYRGIPLAELGRLLGIKEEIKGGRPKDDAVGMHTLGLAIDVNYHSNPWVAGQSSRSKSRSEYKANNRNFSKAVDKATRLVLGQDKAVELTTEELDRIASPDTGKVYDTLFEYSDALRVYLNLDEDGIRSYLRQNGQDPSTVEVWRQGIDSDRKRLIGKGNYKGHDDPSEYGFMDLHRDLVLALRDEALLAWGAVDFGKRASGDMMHFDARRSRELHSFLSSKGHSDDSWRDLWKGS